MFEPVIDTAVYNTLAYAWLNDPTSSQKRSALLAYQCKILSDTAEYRRKLIWQQTKIIRLSRRNA